MEIIKFSHFNEAYQIRQFDLVIGEDGEVKFKRDLPIKGNLDTFGVKRILGSDNKEYIAAIDRSGKLFTFLDKDERGNILLNGKKLPVINVNTNRKFWNTEENYTKLLPLLPTGWVNVKIDMEVIKKIRRYSSGVTKKTGIEGFKDRLEVLGRSDIQLRKRSSETIRKEMSAIMMLHYLNELKVHFDPSSSGFLFESYIAGLITGSTVKEDNSPIDVIDSQNNRYQVKLLKFDSKSSIVMDNDKYLEYYIVGLKFADRIKVFMLNGTDEESENYVNNFRVKPSKNKEGEPIWTNDFSPSKFREYSNKTNYFVYDLPIIEIDERIDKIANGLKNTLDVLYDNLSKFQFNLETILTGVNERGKLISELEFDKIQTDSLSNLIQMQKELSALIGIVRNK